MPYMRPSFWSVPVIFPFGHHISVTRAPVPSTMPRQILRSGLMTMLVRLMVRVVSSLRHTLISVRPYPSSLFLVRACSSISGVGPSTSLTFMVPLVALARSIMAFCLSVSVMLSAGLACRMWVEASSASLTIRPNLAAACLTASTLCFGTDQVSALVMLMAWPDASPAAS